MGDVQPFTVATAVAEMATMTPAQQLARVRELEAAQRRTEAELAVAVAALQSSEAFRDDGHSSVRAQLRAELQWADTDITHRLRTANLLDDLAPVVEAMGRGEVGVAQVRALARARANPRCGEHLTEHAELLLGYTRSMEFADFHRCVRRWELLADLDGSHRDAEANHEARNASLHERDGVGYLSGQGGALDTAELLEIWSKFTEAELLNDIAAAETAVGTNDGRSAPLPRTAAQRRWDALMAVFHAAAGRSADGTSPEPTINIVMDERTFEEALHEMGLAPEPTASVPFHLRRSETSNGTLIDPIHAVRVALFGYIRRVVVSTSGVVLNLGRRRRLFTGAARDAVMLHSPRCIWPGCTTSAGHCNADHTHPWQFGGITDPTNGAPMCPRHDRLKNHGFRVHRDPNGHWHTYRPDGTEIGTAA
ncbi:MAG TPA: hypothetical protein DCR14_00705 [Acidimicrobiaceae bacterium]|nr:hypothetical protein [Acidimicrobiaceae bacterium]